MNHRAALCHPGARQARRAFLLCAAALVGCGSSIRGPKVGPHYQEEPLVVPYPPPPARVEAIPSPPREMKSPVWIDGEWQWKGRRWVWQAGQWEVPYPDGYYAPPTTLRVADGTLYYYQGEWKKNLKKP